MNNIGLALLLAVLIAAPVAAFADQQVVRAHRLEYLYSDVPFSVCGTSGNFDFYILLRQYKATLDGDAWTVQAIHYVEFSLDGQLIARSYQTQFLSDDGHNGFNVLIHCESGKMDTNSHVIYELEDGVISNLHYVLK